MASKKGACRKWKWSKSGRLSLLLSYVAKGRSVGQYPQNAGPNVQEQFSAGGTFPGPVRRTYQDPVGGTACEQSFVLRGRGGGFNRGTASGRKNPKPFVPYDTCARCEE